VPAEFEPHAGGEVEEGRKDYKFIVERHLVRRLEQKGADSRASARLQNIRQAD
jgi:hypothetical protein